MEKNLGQAPIQDRVNAICNDLYSKGTKPSVRLVLSMLPDVRSTSTVHKYFANWKRELESNQQSLYDKLGFSSAFTQSFMKEITRFSVEAEQRYKELAQDANEQRDIALDDLGRSEERLFKQSSVLEQREKERKELQTELLKVQEKFKAELEKEQESYKATVHELRQQLASVSDSNKSLGSANENLRTEIAKTALKLEGNQELVDQLKSQNKELLVENKRLNVEIASLNKSSAGLEATVSGNVKLIDALQQSQDEKQKSFTASEQERQALTNNLNNALKDLDTSKNKIFTLNIKNTELNTTNQEQSRVIKQLTLNQD